MDAVVGVRGTKDRRDQKCSPASLKVYRRQEQARIPYAGSFPTIGLSAKAREGEIVRWHVLSSFRFTNSVELAHLEPDQRDKVMSNKRHEASTVVKSLMVV